jgi:F420-non-reducing hydrogenase iron-sulfur subunit
MVGACLRGECHYAVGNLAAEGKIAVVKRVLERFGLNPDRLAFRMMSSAQGARFVEYATAFQEEIRALGPLGGGEGVTGAELDLRLRAARNALEDKKLRWVEGKWIEFQEEGNLYGEVFTLHELARMYGEVVLDECAIQEIRLRLDGRSLAAADLAREIRIPAHRTLRHLADMRRFGFVSMRVGPDGVPLWTGSEAA